MRRVVVYGAAGFVASALLSRPDPLSRAVTLVDRRVIQQTLVESIERAGAVVDVVRSSSLAGITAHDGDVLIILAGQTDVDEALAEPALAFEANMAIAVDAAEWWRRYAGVRLVYLSSDEVLGPSKVPLDEYAPLRPTQPYAASKAAAELILRCYSETYGLELVVIRSCNLVGGAQRARKLIPTAVQRLAAGRPVPVFGDGLHWREYLAVTDLCEVLWHAATGALPAGIYNCTSASSLQTLEVVRIVAESLGVEPLITHAEDRLVHDRCYAMDPLKLNAYGWKPAVAPADAIAAAAIEMKSAWDNGQVLTDWS